jgi:CBS domain containing-hemolysin-like protein
MDGNFPLDELADIVELNFPQNDYETIAGLVLQKTGRIPQANEVIHFEDFRIVVVRATRHKILEVKLIKNIRR